MTVVKTINAKPHKDADAEEFAVNDWPTSLDEARKVWGEKVAFSLLEDAAVVAVQALYRSKRKGSEKTAALTARQAADVVKGWKPSANGRSKLSPEEKAKRLAAEMQKSGIDVEMLKKMLAS